MRKLLLMFPVLMGCLWGCGTTARLKSGLSPHAIDSLYAYHLPSLIFTISKGNKQESNYFYSDSSLAIRKKVFEDMELAPAMITRTDYDKSIHNHFWSLLNEVERKRKIKGVIPNDSILNFLEKENVNYALITFNSGFSREKGNYGGQLAKGAAIGILTLGMVVPVPMKANSTSITCIIDAQNKEIAFYRKKTAELEPLKYKNLDQQFTSLLNSYFKK